MTKISIIGSAGFIGKNLFSRLKSRYDVSGVDIRGSPTTTHLLGKLNNEARKIFDLTNPDVIIDCKKLPKSVDYYEENREEAAETDLRGTEIIAEWADDNKKKMIYISSDYVYPGETNGYDENSEVMPVNYYGKLRVESEKIVSRLEKHVILRPTVVFGYDINGMNFLMQIASSKEKKKIPYDQISNPTDVRVLADYISLVLKDDVRGLYVATGPETIGRYDFALRIAKHFGVSESLLESISTGELHQAARRPLNNGTNSSRIRNVLNYQCPSIEHSLRRIAKNG